MTAMGRRVVTCAIVCVALLLAGNTACRSHASERANVEVATQNDRHARPESRDHAGEFASRATEPAADARRAPPRPPGFAETPFADHAPPARPADLANNAAPAVLPVPSSSRPGAPNDPTSALDAAWTSLIIDRSERAAALATWALIQRGGPFPHRRDGIVFGNFEKRLPQRPRGTYREYTVPTAGLSHRGARRLVTGPPGELYYTRDHYESFISLPVQP